MLHFARFIVEPFIGSLFYICLCDDYLGNLVGVAMNKMGIQRMLGKLALILVQVVGEL